MKPEELRNKLSDPSWTGKVLHLLPQDHYERQHIPGAAPACVYEVTFLDQVSQAGAAPATQVVLCGACSLHMDVDAAREKLAVAGYTQVFALEGGLDAWVQAGLPVEGSGALGELVPQRSAYTGRYRVVTEESVIRWTGRNAFNHHEGTVRLSGGSVELASGQLVDAAFTVDMGSIACSDITDAGVNAMLIRHLRDSDFFAVHLYPTAGFWLTGAVELPGARLGVPNFQLTGLFQLRGITQEITFPAQIAPNGPDRITAQAQFEIDRTRWGVNYGSSKFFRFLGKHLVNDHIHLHLKLHVQREG